MLCKFEKTIFQSSNGYCVFSYQTQDVTVPDAEISVSIEEDEDYESLSPDELADRWDDLRIQRDILDSEEPDDPDSEAYEEWEEQCELLDEKIEEIEDLIEG